MYCTSSGPPGRGWFVVVVVVSGGVVGRRGRSSSQLLLRQYFFYDMAVPYHVVSDRPLMLLMNVATVSNQAG